MKTTLSPEQMERAWRARDAEYDGLFFFGVKTTGVFCRPSCPSRPKRGNLEFFRTLGEAMAAGYRPCKRCHPELANGTPPPWVSKIMEQVLAEPDVPLKAESLRAAGVSPERLRRWFRAHYGMTFAAWCRGTRLSRSFSQLRSGESLDDVILGNGFASHSGFREAFGRVFGKPPGRARGERCLRVRRFETPLGPMVAAATDEGICLLEFADRRGLEAGCQRLGKRFRLPVVPGNNAMLDRLAAELRQYFSGARRSFDVPVILRGSPFQEAVWKVLRKIPYGETVSYHEVARRISRPAACRAVARANGMNCLYLLIPCHRVVAKDGSLSGYGGGVWRKKGLLDLERRSIAR